MVITFEYGLLKLHIVSLFLTLKKGKREKKKKKEHKQTNGLKSIIHVC